MIEKAFILINKEHPTEGYGWVYVKEPHYLEEQLAIEVKEFTAWQVDAESKAILKSDLIEMPMEKYYEWERAYLVDDDSESIVQEVINAHEVMKKLE